MENIRTSLKLMIKCVPTDSCTCYLLVSLSLLFRQASRPKPALHSHMSAHPLAIRHVTHAPFFNFFCSFRVVIAPTSITVLTFHPCKNCLIIVLLTFLANSTWSLFHLFKTWSTIALDQMWCGWFILRHSLSHLTDQHLQNRSAESWILVKKRVILEWWKWNPVEWLSLKKDHLQRHAPPGLVFSYTFSWLSAQRYCSTVM